MIIKLTKKQTENTDILHIGELMFISEYVTIENDLDKDIYIEL